MTRFMIAVSTAVLLAAGAGSSAMAAEAAAAAAPASPAQEFATRAGQSDVYEQLAGQLAVSYGTNAAVKDFGAMMVADHGRSSAEMAGAATTGGVTVGSPGLSPAQSAMITALVNAPAGQFDALYVSQQVQAHQDALTLLNGYAASGDNAALKAAAAKAAPMVRTHLERAQALAAQVR